MGFGKFMMNVGRALLDFSKEAAEMYIEQKEQELMRNGGFESEEDYEKYARRRKAYDKRVELTYERYNSTLEKLESLRKERDNIISKLECDDLTDTEKENYRSKLNDYNNRISNCEERMQRLSDDVLRYEKKNY